MCSEPSSVPCTGSQRLHEACCHVAFYHVNACALRTSAAAASCCDVVTLSERLTSAISVGRPCLSLVPCVVVGGQTSVRTGEGAVGWTAATLLRSGASW